MSDNLNKPDDEQLISLPSFVAVAWKNFMLERASGTFEINVQDGRVMSATKRVVYRTATRTRTTK